MAHPEDGGFDLARTYVQLQDGAAADLLDAGGDFWARLAERVELHDGRLVCVTPQTADWTSWEMHPAGDEIVYLLSGAVSLILEEEGGERSVELGARMAYRIPRGRWHRMRVRAPGEMLFITRGAGTRHRPL
jgi:mannose-6-phosphate isomerase-like protein (cupin superfamily)